MCNRKGFNETAADDIMCTVHMGRRFKLDFHASHRTLGLVGDVAACHVAQKPKDGINKKEGVVDDDDDDKDKSSTRRRRTIRQQLTYENRSLTADVTNRLRREDECQGSASIGIDMKICCIVTPNLPPVLPPTPVSSPVSDSGFISRPGYFQQHLCRPCRPY